MASLAFVGPHGAYISAGTYCFLPVRPFWYRLGLSWIPRYIILGTILGIYIVIYLYVRRKFRMIENDLDDVAVWRKNSGKERAIGNGAGGLDGEDSPQIAMRRSLPRLRHHGLISSTLTSRISEDGWMQQSNTIIFDGSGVDMHETQYKGEEDLHTSSQQKPGIVASSSATCTMLERPTLANPQPSSNQHSSIGASSVISIFEALKDSRLTTYAMDRIDQRLIRTTVRGDFSGPGSITPAGDQLRKTHVNLLRQLRLLFVYPVVYFLMLMIPFASHCLQYNDYYAQHPSFVLSCLVTIFVALQCTVDCYFFSTREKV